MTACCARSEPLPPALVEGAPRTLPVAVIGGGPVGLAAAARLLERGMEPIVLEAGPSVGTAALAWGHVRMFSPWRYNIDRACRTMLETQGWTEPDPEEFPNGQELVARYLEPLAKAPEMVGRIRTGARVTAVGRAGLGKVRSAGRDAAPFEVRVEAPDGRESMLLAKAVIDASGTWFNPSPAGASGLAASGERAAADRIRYGMPDLLGAERGRYAGRRVMVLGSGDSALGVLIDLARLATEAPGTEVIWAARNADLSRALGGGAADQLPERGALGMKVRRLAQRGALKSLKPFCVHEIQRAPDQSLLVIGDVGGFERGVACDELIVVTGLRPDLDILREVRTDLDPALECPRALASLIDPNVHSCGTVRPHGGLELRQPEPGLFIAGMKSYGRAPTFLLATGYEQVRSIAALLAGDLAAATRVELELPETGVCSGPAPAGTKAACCTAETPQSTCCAPKAELPADAPCCGATPRTEPALAEPAE
jgi:hypothetical protein